MGDINAISGLAPPAPTPFTSPASLASFKIPLKAYLQEHPQFNSVAVAAFVFNEEGKLLIVQRAAHDSFPLLWEVPGGACDYEDESLLHAVARELWEESGLRAKSIVTLVGKGLPIPYRGNRCMCKYSFLTEVEQYDIKLDPNEHQAFLWVTEEEAKAGRCGDVEFRYTTKDQRLSVCEAFKLRNSGKAQAD
ncbi:NUDIX hydrolase domain-like protein [Daldinia caldariorum]|uniref:NUDIX hydrolase domain-like protein n=1 Tax=Daldinia caldariorum TaxID=326644 RepID=UPI0020084FFF|nr:NUDIX hydrolase domain-like protein [Daldinia caldariorum]KAI1465087.1 NUDIX hydrolase domain-like protein [Daldinia caldariorum]